MKRTALFIFSVCAFLSAQAQSDTIDLVPVEVKAIRASATAPFTKTNIKKDEIREQNLGQDLPFLLNNTPSVVVNSDAGNGIGYTGIRIRGTDATRINVTLNGIPFNDAESNGSFFVNLPDFLSSVNSIQIQRGVGTSSNGAGAFGATINLSTNDLIKERSIEFNNSYGSFNSLKNTIIYNSGLLNNHFTVDARLSRITSDGYVDRATSNLRSYYLSTAFTNEKSSLRFTTFSGKERTYQAWNGISEADLKTNRRINYSGMEKADSPYEDEVDNYNQSHYQLFFNRKLFPGLTFNTGLFLVRGKGYYEQYKADE
ncbi:MAG TPA: TonB-dependent receptor, partial [Flavisolibacter sp.]|nr:TonB-dependent receptor [Flavisolibacter sp.]